MAEEEFFDEDLLSKGYLPEDEAVTDLGSITPGNVPDNNFNEDLLSQGYDAEIPDSSLTAPTPSVPAPNYSTGNSFLDMGVKMAPDIVASVGAVGGGFGGGALGTLVAPGVGTGVGAAGGSVAGASAMRLLANSTLEELGLRDPNLGMYEAEKGDTLGSTLSFGGDMFPLVGTAARTVRGGVGMGGRYLSKAINAGRKIEGEVLKDSLSGLIENIPGNVVDNLLPGMGKTEKAKFLTDKAKDLFNQARTAGIKGGVSDSILSYSRKASESVADLLASPGVREITHTPTLVSEITNTAEKLRELGIAVTPERIAKELDRTSSYWRDSVSIIPDVSGDIAKATRLTPAAKEEVVKQMLSRETELTKAPLYVLQDFKKQMAEAAYAEGGNPAIAAASDKIRYLLSGEIKTKLPDDARRIFESANTVMEEASIFDRAANRISSSVSKQLGSDAVNPILGAIKGVEGGSGGLLQLGSANYKTFPEEGFMGIPDTLDVAAQLEANPPAPTIVPPPTVNSMDESGKVSDPIDRKVIGSQAEEIYKKDSVSRFETKKANNTGKAIPAKFINDAGGQAPEEVSEEVSYLRDKEGALKQPYVLKGEGVTLSTGLYLGDKDADSLREMGVTNEKLISKLSPVLGEKSEKRAKGLLSSSKLKLSTKELEELEKASINYHNGVTEKDFKAMTGEELSDAPKPARMVLYSLGYLSGSIKRTKEASIRKVAGLIAEGKYSRAYTTLVSLSKSKNYKHANRFAKEAETLSQLVNENQYASYDSTEKVASTVTLPDGKVKTNYS